MSAQEERREQESEVEAQGKREQESEEVRNRMHEECVEEKRERESRNQLCEDSDVSNRHMTWWKKAWWIRIDESGEQPEERPNRLAMVTGLEKLIVSPKRRNGRSGEEDRQTDSALKTRCTWCCICHQT